MWRSFFQLQTATTKTQHIFRQKQVALFPVWWETWHLPTLAEILTPGLSDCTIALLQQLMQNSSNMYVQYIHFAVQMNAFYLDLISVFQNFFYWLCRINYRVFKCCFNIFKEAKFMKSFSINQFIQIKEWEETTPTTFLNHVRIIFF